MRKLLMLTVFTTALSTAAPAFAHCDGEDGPVAGAARRALNAGNVSLALPFAPAAAEPEIARAFGQASAVRALGPEARALADRHFAETVVRLHRAGEGAPYTGLRPADTDYGPAIPAAEQALETGEAEPLIELLVHGLRQQIAERLEHARVHRGAPAKPRSTVEVAAAREQVSQEFAFIEYVEGLRQTMESGIHAEAAAHHD